MTMNFFFCSVLIIVLISCEVPKKTLENCTLKSAIEEAKDRMKKKGFRLDQYNVSYARHEKAYLIVFSLIEIGDGGGAEITISKHNCKIIDERYHQ